MRSFNDMIKDAREELKAGLAKCTEGQQHLFKQMYAPAPFDMPIDEVVDVMPEFKLKWAMEQVSRTLDKPVAPKETV